MENISKNKRGRPQILRRDTLRASYYDKGRRQQDNMAYTQLFGMLVYPDGSAGEPLDPIYLFLWDNKKVKIKATVSAELGRLAVRSGDDVALQAARVICEKKMNTARALAFLRRFRKTKTGAAWSVLGKILRLIDDSLLSADELETLRQNLNDCLSPQNQEGE
ncbi:MAG TPA: hypothetical protein PKK37_05260 [Candidatus Pacearchaeota archaeon]|nr:hypothetical protein [Candidatus Pacearchaeota archaeon]